MQPLHFYTTTKILAARPGYFYLTSTEDSGDPLAIAVATAADVPCRRRRRNSPGSGKPGVASSEALVGRRGEDGQSPAWR